MGFRNRSQRLLEYAERRQDIMSVSSLPSARVLGKRPAVRQESLDRPKSFSSIRDDEKHAMGRTLIFGQWNGSDSLGYVHLFVLSSAADHSPFKAGSSTIQRLSGIRCSLRYRPP